MTTSKVRATVAPITVRLTLPDDVTAPAVARSMVRETLTDLGVSGVFRDDVLLATSELVTNAFEHGEPPKLMKLRFSENQLEVSVFDSGTELPQLKEPSPTEARSRGLQLVRALSQEWGYECCDGGKHVWATFALSNS
ncbi:ATP-binding protein [Amycolatopsis sp. PS_44_ISF1]|uniref:ATP-binding protein n=1 Tax=Amycolatopsis sp. PS_44_ISF1 TaxID=2974917 RepID=UPI0028E0674C|nr:ATP-binding protein [Amycolatopsis sp. PS_44_ISF1]MDT8910203.1 ATP-binding protein [Amycolatopsis sp. PS_44_ISF1]